MFAGLRLTGFIFMDSAMRNYNTTLVFIKFDNLKLSLLIYLHRLSVFFHQVLARCQTFDAIRQSHNAALVRMFNERALVDRTFRKDGFEYIPRIIFKLFMTERNSAV